MSGALQKGTYQIILCLTTVTSRTRFPLVIFGMTPQMWENIMRLHQAGPLIVSAIVASLAVAGMRPACAAPVISEAATSNMSFSSTTDTWSPTQTNAVLNEIDALVGDAGTHIFHVFVSGSITGDTVTNAGGLVGVLTTGGIIDRCRSTASVSLSGLVGPNGSAAGGLGGEIEDTIIESYATGNVSVPASGVGGGLVGNIANIEASISNSYATGERGPSSADLRESATRSSHLPRRPPIPQAP